MHMSALRHHGTWAWLGGIVVALKKRDVCEVVRQHAGSKQSGDSASNDDGMVQRWGINRLLGGGFDKIFTLYYVGMYLN